MQKANHNALPTGIYTPNGFLSFSSIHQLFSTTPYGKKLAKKIRWNYYKPAEFSQVMWQRHLGYDANNLHHLYTTYLLTRTFLKYSSGRIPHDHFSTQEQETLLFSAVVHDWGEALVGDILAPLKTEEDELKEKQILAQVMGEVLKGYIKEAQIEQVVSCIFGEKSTRICMVFNTIEKLGYAKTGLRAWQQSILVQDSTIQRKLRSLTYSVCVRDLSALLELSLRYNAVDQFLLNKKRTISHAFDTMLPDIKETFANIEKRTWAWDTFKNTKKSWNQYLKSKNL